MWQLVALRGNWAWAWACFAITLLNVVASFVVNTNRIFNLPLSFFLFSLRSLSISIAVVVGTLFSLRLHLARFSTDFPLFGTIN